MASPSRLVATWKRKLAGEALVGANLPTVLAELARRKPEFVLPTALGHTRHFMPLKFPDQGDRTKVFDAFVSLSPDSEVIIHWPDATLSADGHQTLDLVLSQLGYLGRAKSWSAARVLSKFDPARINCRPGPAEAGQESVRVLTTDPEKWNSWEFKDRKIVKPNPLWNLLAETADLHLEKWSDPPGSKWVTYARPSDTFASRTTPQRQIRPMSLHCTVARYALDGPVLPLVQNTLPLAESIRRTLMGCYKQIKLADKYGHDIPDNPERFASEVFSGKDAAGTPLSGHGHAYYLPTDEGHDGRIDHVTVLAANGFSEDEIRALDRFRQVRHRDGEPLRLLLVGLGQEGDFRAALRRSRHLGLGHAVFGDALSRAARPQARSARVLCHTAPLRWPCAQPGIGALRRRPELPDWEVIELTEGIGPQRMRPIQFQRFRDKQSDDGGRRPSGGFRIAFAAQLRGPFCLGHSAHFGLGLFLSESGNIIRQ